jgi:hypothetical protein
MTPIRPAHADTVYQEPEAFIVEALGAVPKPDLVWLTPTLQQRVAAVLGHPYRQARLRYWQAGPTQVWILDEIGKEFPITAGFVVRAARIASARVLVYRESRGGEIHQKGFVRQFEGAGLGAGGRLDTRIDGITGATMSVDAMQRMAQVALLLSTEVAKSEGAK